MYIHAYVPGLDLGKQLWRRGVTEAKHTHICTHTHTHKKTHAYTCLNTHTHTQTHTNMHANTCGWVGHHGNPH